MAIQRRNLNQIIDEIYRITGNYNRASGAGLDTPWRSNANLIRIINDYLQQLSQRAAQVVQKNVPRRPIRFDMYKTVTHNSVGGLLSAPGLGDNTIYFPVDFDEIITLYSLSENEPIHAIQDVSRFHKDLKERAPGPPEYYEMLGFVSATALRSAKLWPRCPAAYAYDLELVYWRLPAAMDGIDLDNEYPDIDPKYEMLAIKGPAREILQPADPGYDRLAAEEKELLLDLVMSGRSS